MVKYSSEEKLEVVFRYLEGKESSYKIAKSIGTDSKAILKWVKQYEYNGVEAFIKRYTNYSAQFKLDVLNYMILHGTSLLETAAIFNNPGPLADFRGQPNKNFYGGRYNIEVLNEPKIFYRAGDVNSPLGQWFTETLPSSVAKVRIDTAVIEQWIDKNGVLSGTSPLNTVFKIEIPTGTTIYKGPVGNQGGIYQGGLDINQIYIKEPWNIEVGVKVIDSSPLK